MLVCENCETAQFLQITSSRLYHEDETALEITENVCCTVCDLTGTVEYDLGRDTVTVSGGLVRDTTTRPVTIADARGEVA